MAWDDTWVSNAMQVGVAAADPDNADNNLELIKTYLNSLTLTFKEYGLAITTGTDTEHDVNIAAGARWDSTRAAKITYSAGTIAIDAAAGINSIDTGTVANSTMYYIWICSGATGTGAIFSTSSTAPTLPAGYNSYKELIGARITDGSANIDTTQSWTRHADGTWTYEYTQASGNFPSTDTTITHNLNSTNIDIDIKAIDTTNFYPNTILANSSNFDATNPWNVTGANAVQLVDIGGTFNLIGAAGYTNISNSASYRLKAIIKTRLV